MSRHSFRSQPSLQRSGARPPSFLLGLAGLAALGLGFGLVSALQDRPVAGGQVYGAAALEPAAVASAQVPPSAPALAPPAVAVPSPPLAAAPAPAIAKPPTKVRAARAARPPRVQAASAPSPQQAWEQQRQDYERAIEVYDAQEKTEGYRWAQQNRIRVERYCRAAERRTPAFLQGCLSYVRRDGAAAGAPG